MSWFSILGHGILTPLEKRRLRQKRWYWKDIEASKARGRKKYEKRKEKCAAYAKANRERKNADSRRWNKTPKGKEYRRLSSRAYRLARKNLHRISLQSNELVRTGEDLQCHQ